MNSLFKNRITFALAVILIAAMVFCITGCGKSQKTIKISGAYALYPMMSIWTAEYNKSHPEIKFEVSGGGAGKGMADALAGLVDLGMVSREIKKEETDQGAVWVAVVKDAVVVTMNAGNPVYDKIAAKGLTHDQFVKIFLTREIKTWGDLVGDPTITDKIKVYTRADSCGAAETWAKYLGKYTQEDLTKAADAGIMNDPDLAAAVKNDKFGIGYNNINFAYDVKTMKPIEGIRVVPIDINGNGTLEPNENFYANMGDLLKAIAGNVYPSPPARDLNIVAKGEFKGEVKDFAKWILTDGQKIV
jgi:phosphate transport system substrate-binding protein